MTPQQLMEYYQEGMRERGGCGGPVLITMFMILLLFVLTGCKTQYVPVVETHTVYVSKTDTFLQKDSVFFHDSVFIHSKGDTVWYERWKVEYRDRWKERIVTDTVMRSDSIPVPYPVPAQLSAWQKIKVDFGGYAILIVIAVITVLIYRLKKILP